VKQFEQLTAATLTSSFTAMFNGKQQTLLLKQPIAVKFDKFAMLTN